eukprot:GFUD01002664.1.p1 GENE.GFUD01002664.1~~GFUD01002664.1.p1  ORF type:complete len:258 (+),score=54.20 GFUD01002664.1:265-1038(+)
MNISSRNFFTILVVFNSIVRSSSLAALTVRSRSVKKDSSESDIKTTISTHEATTKLYADIAQESLKNDTSAEIELPAEQVVPSRTLTESPGIKISPNVSTPSSPPRKPFEGSVTILFVAIFVIGFIGVVVFYIWKRSTDSTWRVPATYQYSVLNAFDNDPDDELTDHLRVGDDFIVSNDSSDDDVELLGQNSLTNHQVEGSSLLLSFGNGPNPTSVIGTVTRPTQVNGVHPSMAPSQFPNGRISSAILDDSDEELLQ